MSMSPKYQRIPEWRPGWDQGNIIAKTVLRESVLPLIDLVENVSSSNLIFVSFIGNKSVKLIIIIDSKLNLHN